MTARPVVGHDDRRMQPRHGRGRPRDGGGTGRTGQDAGTTRRLGRDGLVNPEGRYGWRERDRVVPVYAFTGGRTRAAGRELPLETVVTAIDQAAGSVAGLATESRAILELCRGPMSLAEIGAGLGVPVGVARVLVGDLANAGYLEVHLPAAAGDGGPGQVVLGRLLDGLRGR